MKLKSFDPDEWVSVHTAASLADVHREWMRRLAQRGTVRAFSIEGQWFIFKADAESYERDPNRGRPRVAKRRK